MKNIFTHSKFLTMLPALVAIIASGFLVARVENTISLLSAIAIVLSFIGVATIKNQQTVSDKASINLHNNLRISTLVLSLCCTIVLAWLVLQRRALPIEGFGTSALVTILFSLVSVGLVWLILDFPLLSFPMIFLGMTFLYTTSSLILYQMEGFYAFRYWSFVNIQGAMEAMPVVMLAFSSFLTGAFIFDAKNSSKVSKKYEVDFQVHDGLLRSIGILIYLASMLVIIILGAQFGVLDLIVNGGYRAFSDAKRVNQISSLIISSLNWFLPWSLLILTATSRDRRRFTNTLFLAIPALGIMLITGDRSTLIPIIILMASARHFLGGPVNWRQTILIIALAMALMPSVLILRKIPLQDWSSEILVDNMATQVNGKSYPNSSFIVTILGDMSSSYQTLVGTLLLVPDHYPYRFGTDYLKSLVFAVPFANSLVSSLEIDLQTDLPSEWVKFNSVSNPGSSGWGYLQVAEAYLQFGAFGVVAVYLGLGLLLPKLWWQLHHNTSHNSRFLAFSLIVMIALITWVRNYSGPVPRAMLWGWLLTYGLPWFVEKIRNKNSPAKHINPV